MFKRLIRKIVRTAAKWLNDGVEDLPLFEHPRYVETVSLYSELNLKYSHSYSWGVIQGAKLAKALKLRRISVVEFGVAGGNGLIALENIAIEVEKYFDISIDVYGFDTARGLPKPNSPYDLPHICGAGDFRMEAEKLASVLKRAKLILGQVNETIGAFSQSGPAPVAFASFDMDYYSSTKHALRLLHEDQAILLPRIQCYFDDVFACGDFDGERLAIAEFNEFDIPRKISKIHGLKYLVPQKVSNRMMWEKYYMAYIFDHELFSRSEGYLQDSLALEM